MTTYRKEIIGELQEIKRLRIDGFVAGNLDFHAIYDCIDNIYDICRKNGRIVPFNLKRFDNKMAGEEALSVGLNS